MGFPGTVRNDYPCPAPPPHPRAPGFPGGLGWLRRYWALMRAAWLVDLQYRPAILIWVLLGVAQPLVMLSVWWNLAGEGTVGGYGQGEFARYFFALMLVDQLTLAWDVWYVDRWIREGELNFRLVRPLDPIHEALADNLAYKAGTASLLVLVWLGVAVFWPAVRLPFEPWQWAGAVPAVVLAAGIRFFVSYTHGLLAFWMTRGTGLFELHHGVSLFLAGRVAPLELLPPWAGLVAGGLWFRSMLAFPVEVLTGGVGGWEAYVEGLAIQGFWLVVWWGAYRLAWTRGTRRYEGVGG